jgi:hypothetical protein
MITKYTKDILNIIIILILSWILISDLFLHKGQPATFDGPTHITNIALMHRGLSEGEFPVYWGDGFARYGMPIPLIAQQLPSYIGALITFITHDVVLSFNIVYFIGAALSAIALYIFLRIYVSPFSALIAATLFHFAPYRIINVYIRGALPEFFASTFVAIILIALYLAIEKEKKYAYMLLAISVAFLILTHPFVLVIGSFLFIPYSIYLLKNKKHIIKRLFWLSLSVGIGIGLTGYYLVPLIIEIRYFYYGRAESHFALGHFLTLKQIFEETWPYFYKDDIQPRGHVHTLGRLESRIIIVGFLYAVAQFWKKERKLELLHVFLLVSIVLIFLLLPTSEFLYTHIKLLGNIQHPWRMFSAMIFIPPILLALLLEKVHKKTVLILGILFVLFVAFLRFPQLYGKNVVQFPQRSYYYTTDNLHGIVLNTVWTGPIIDYQIKKEKPAIVEGEGVITKKEVGNSWRRYAIDAKTKVRLVDYTFYFPGWKVYVDGVQQEIQYQDPNYRGIITYDVSAGKHEVQLIFTDTMVRLAGKLMSIGSLFLLILLGFFPKWKHYVPILKKLD